MNRVKLISSTSALALVSLLLQVEARGQNLSPWPYAESCNSSGANPGTWPCFSTTNTANWSNSYGIIGNSTGAGIGVAGGSATGIGLLGGSTSGPGVNGQSVSNTGVLGNSSTGYGIHGVSSSSTAILGEAFSSNIGVEGSSPSGYGVYGSSTSSFGIYGSSSSGIGVGGTSSSDYGLYGTSSSNYGIYGISSTNAGIVGVTGSVGGAAAISALSPNNSGLALWGTGNIIITGSTAQKAGGGSWTAPSDKRIKKDVTDFRQGLTELMRVRAVRFKYNGLGGTSDDGREYVGVIAQEIEKIVPAMVSSRKAKLHDSDAQTTDIKQVDPSDFTYLLINAVQEQQRVIQRQEARIAALEQGKTPLASSLPSLGGIKMAAAFGLLPIGMVVVARKRRKQKL
jgi:hypothetical protein